MANAATIVAITKEVKEMLADCGYQPVDDPANNATRHDYYEQMFVHVRSGERLRVVLDKRRGV
jgi:hypothetical protein